MEKPKLYGIAEIAAEIGARPQTVAQWRRRGELPPPDAELKSGPVWVGETIDAWLKSSDWEVLSVARWPKRAAFQVRVRVGWGDEFLIALSRKLASSAGLETKEEIEEYVSEQLTHHHVDRRMKEMRTGAMPYVVRWHVSPAAGQSVRILPDKEQEMDNVAPVNPGESVSLEAGDKHGSYTVTGVQPQLLELRPQAASLEPGEEPPSFSPIPNGADGVLTLPDGTTRNVRIVAGGLGVTVGPRRMRIGDPEGADVCDCPRCWREAVEGSPTGTGFAFSAGPHIPEPIPTIEFKCPDCSLEWDSLNFRDFAHGKFPS